MVASTRLRQIRQTVQPFTKTCHRCLARLTGMTSTTDENPKRASLRGKSANSGTFVPDFGERSVGNFSVKEFA